MKHPARKWLMGVATAMMLASFPQLLAQSDAAENFYAQKIMLENTIRHRVSDAIFKITDNDKFVVDVKVFMDVKSGRTFQTIYAPLESPTWQSEPTPVPSSAQPTSQTGPAGETLTPLPKPGSRGASQSGNTPKPVPVPKGQNLDEILPGIPSIQKPQTDLLDTELTPAASAPDTAPAAIVDSLSASSDLALDTSRVTPQSAAAAAQPLTEASIPYAETPAPVAPPVGKRLMAVQNVTAPVIKVKRVDITIILQDQIDPTTVENIRQVSMVASHFDRSRGDVLNIMTASFKDGQKTRTTAEQVLLKSIADRMAVMEKHQKAKADSDRSRALILEHSRLQKEREDIAQLRQQEEDRLKQREVELKQQRETEQQKLAQREETLRKSRQAEEQRLADERAKLYQQQRNQAQVQLKADSLRIALLAKQLKDLQGQLKSGDMEEEHRLKLELEQRKKEQERTRLEQEQAKLSEKFQTLQQKPLEAETAPGGTNNKALYFILGGAALLILILGLVFAAMNRRPTAIYPEYPGMGRTPADDDRINKAAEKAAQDAEKRIKDLLKAQRQQTGDDTVAPPSEKLTDETLGGAAGTGYAPTTRQPTIRPEEAARAEMDDVRKSVVSLAIGRPDSASKIIGGWLQDAGGATSSGSTDSEAQQPRKAEES